jgi:hypothetical protein
MVPSIHPKVYDPETNVAILSSTRDMPRDVHHVMVTVDGRVALSFDIESKLDHATKTIIYSAPVERIRSGFSRSRNMLSAFQSESAFLSKLHDALEFMYDSTSSLIKRGWKVQIVLI